ncbi:hypothetical protein [uncultured Lamprocystis sp.]|jgi:hypothetical protein|uniref:hypothetical protein n=1 Tax=uncultured Lamprocystis sp. TaxID=543132 RepID=UPI0025E467FC|nr:hypothetical protein [uncultured Lamprocystis sp.]
MSDKPVTVPDPDLDHLDEPGRRDFLIGLGRWSKIAIGVAVFGGMAGGGTDAEAGWINRRGGGGGWVIGGGGGGWINGGGGGWINRRGGGGGSWINRR